MIEIGNQILQSNVVINLIISTAALFLIIFIGFFILSKLKGIASMFLSTFFNKEKLSVATITVLIYLYVFFPFYQFTSSSTLKKTLMIIIILAAMWFFLRLISVLKDVVYSYFPLEKEDNLHERKVRTQFQYIQIILSMIIIITGIAFILWQFDDLRGIGTGLLASAGIFGLIIAFAAQSTLGNLIAGFQIAFAQPFRLDDVVIVEDEWGRIEEITLTYVVVRIWDQRRLVLPISYFINHPFENWTRRTSDILGTIFLYVDHSISVNIIRDELQKIVKTSDLWDEKLALLQVTDTTEKTIELRALVSAKDASDAWNLRCYVREKMISFLQKNYPESLPKIRIAREKMNT